MFHWVGLDTKVIAPLPRSLDPVPFGSLELNPFQQVELDQWLEQNPPLDKPPDPGADQRFSIYQHLDDDLKITSISMWTPNPFTCLTIFYTGCENFGSGTPSLATTGLATPMPSIGLGFGLGRRKRRIQTDSPCDKWQRSGTRRIGP